MECGQYSCSNLPASRSTKLEAIQIIEHGSQTWSTAADTTLKVPAQVSLVSLTIEMIYV